MIETHDPWMVEVIERFCIDLQCRIDDLTQQLNQAKDKLDGMARCSQLLDKVSLASFGKFRLPVAECYATWLLILVEAATSAIQQDDSLTSDLSNFD